MLGKIHASLADRQAVELVAFSKLHRYMD
jgi:hypothetical protein